MKSSRWLHLLLAATFVSGVGQATTVFQRALPSSTNVNNAAGANRSNVDWASGSAQLTYIVGDDFSFNDLAMVDSISVFEIANNPVGGAPSSPSAEFANIMLYVGAHGSTLSLASSSYTSSLVAYAPAGFLYQGASGTDYYQIYELTFSGLNLTIPGSTLYDFAVDATPNAGACATAPNGDPCLLFLSASNAALSGTTQDGADGLFKAFTSDGSGGFVYAGSCDSAVTSGPNYCGTPPGGPGPALWNKSSDINVLIDGTVIPEPSTVTTMAMGLAGLAFLVRRRRKI